jgi:hypothetical protein
VSLFLPCAASFWLVGCPPSAYEYRLYNNSGVNVSLAVRKKIVVVMSGAYKTVTATDVANIEVDGGTTWSYSVSGLPYSLWSPYIKTTEGKPLSSHFTLQLEPDGKLYLLSNLSALPSTSLALQPKGFPLAPSDEKRGLPK